MTRKTTIVLAFAAMLGLVIWGLAGCGGGGGGTAAGGTGQLQLSLVDAPLNADQVNVDITSVQVHSAENGWVTVKEFSTPLHVNLLDYSSSGTSLMLADSPLTAGHFTMLRLMLSSAEVVVGGQPHPVDLTNVAQTGVKCNGQFTVEAGQMMALVLDFNAAKSFVPAGNGSTYTLHPVMTMSPKSAASEVVGTVEFKDADGNTQPVPADAMVNVYTAGHIGDAGYLVSGAPVGTDGTFRISVLPQGSYDFEVIANSASVKQMTGVAVTPPTTDLGIISVTLQAPQPIQ